MRHDIPPDQHGPLGNVMADAVSKCVHCGFCLPACPTYHELGRETDSPRGRILLMKEVLEGSMPLDSAAPHLDACLGCVACEPACPSEVPYGELISPFRSLHEQQRKRPFIVKLQRLLAQATLPYPKRFRLAALSGRLAKPLARLLPTPLRAMLELLPDKLPASQPLKEVYPAVGNRRARVALMAGCAQTVLDPDINLATIDVLTRNGVEVLVPPDQVCCGALSWHVGNREQARRFSLQNLDAFPTDVDAILSNAAGCGSGMHEYPLINKGKPEEPQARAFAEKVLDVSVFLARLGTLEPFPKKEQTIRVAYHDACHLANAQGVRSEPRELLRQIPGLELLEIADSQYCCGSAGTYNIDQPAVAHSLGKQKAENVVNTGADIVVMGNIGCLTQLSIHLAKTGSPIKTRHTLQLIRDAYHGDLHCSAANI